MATATFQSLRRHVLSSRRIARLFPLSPSTVFGPSAHSLPWTTFSSTTPAAARCFSQSFPMKTAAATATEPASAAGATESVQAKPASKLTIDESVEEEDQSKGVHFRHLEGKVHRHTLKAITNHPFQHTHMTAVQEAVLPLLPHIAEPHDHTSPSKGPRDLLVRAKTGTGKTLAFLVPAIEARVKAIQARVDQAVEAAGERADKHLKLRTALEFARQNAGALVISPTRELATQIAVEAQKLTHHQEGFEVRLCTGGESKGGQIREWRRGRKDIVVGTPGRIRDLLESVPLFEEGLKNLQVLVLDEADTLLDMGFRDDLDAILERLPQSPQRQTFLFSATVSRAVEQIARKSLNQDSHVFINTVSDTESPVHAHVPQYHTVLPSASEQLPHLLRLLVHDQLMHPLSSKVILFCATTKMTQLMTTIVREMARTIFPAGRQTNVFEIHSRLTQSQRTRASDNFRSKKGGASILVTSDVSARGVDYPNVTRVIQIGVPVSAEQYIHRVGRTGRSGGIVGRGDLVLLPWEIGFLQSLREVPLKPVTSADLERQVNELASRFDEDPKALFGDESESVSNRTVKELLNLYKHPYSSTIAALPTELKSLLSSLDPSAVEETFSAILGFYSSRTNDLRVSMGAIIQGCKDWSVEALGLSEPPYVSESLLKRLGGGGGKGGMRRGGSSQRFGDDRRPKRFGGASSWTDEPRRQDGRRDFRRRDDTAGFDGESHSRGYGGLSTSRPRRSFGDESQSRGYGDNQSFSRPRRSFGDESQSSGYGDNKSFSRPRRSFDDASDSESSHGSFGGISSKTQATLSGRGNFGHGRGRSGSESGNTRRPWEGRGRQ